MCEPERFAQLPSTSWAGRAKLSIESNRRAAREAALMVAHLWAAYRSSESVVREYLTTGRPDLRSLAEWEARDALASIKHCIETRENIAGFYPNEHHAELAMSVMALCMERDAAEAAMLAAFGEEAKCTTARSAVKMAREAARRSRDLQAAMAIAAEIPDPYEVVADIDGE
jgi:hypothetical protein